MADSKNEVKTHAWILAPLVEQFAQAVMHIIEGRPATDCINLLRGLELFNTGPGRLGTVSASLPAKPSSLFLALSPEFREEIRQKGEKEAFGRFQRELPARPRLALNRMKLLDFRTLLAKSERYFRNEVRGFGRVAWQQLTHALDVRGLPLGLQPEEVDALFDEIKATPEPKPSVD